MQSFIQFIKLTKLTLSSKLTCEKYVVIFLICQMRKQTMSFSKNDYRHSLVFWFLTPYIHCCYSYHESLPPNEKHGFVWMFNQICDLSVIWPFYILFPITFMLIFLSNLVTFHLYKHTHTHIHTFSFKPSLFHCKLNNNSILWACIIWYKKKT